MADSMTSLRRKRGVIKASITKLTTKLTELERGADATSVAPQARLMSDKLESLDKEFRTYHFAIVDAADSDEDAAAEQSELDTHDDNVASLQVRLGTLLSKLVTPLSVHHITTEPSRDMTPDRPATTIDGRTLIERKLSQLESRVEQVSKACSKLTADPKELHMIDLYSEQLTEFKRELSDIRNEAISLARDNKDPLIGMVQNMDRQLFDLSVTAKQLLYKSAPAATAMAPPVAPPPEKHNVKLPRIEVPSFNGEMLEWQTFWEQFSIAIHDRKDISNTQKLVYLRQSLKDGTAKSSIEGLSSSGEQYDEAVASLKDRYNRPRVLHQSHVKQIYELTSLKSGSGKELRKFHDTAQQHLRALKAMGQEPSGPFVTSLLELKLDHTTLFEWQKASQDSKDVPSYSKLLEFINLRAQANELCPQDKSNRSEFRKQLPGGKHVHTHTAAESGNTNCLVCKTVRHPLYACPRFHAMSRDNMLTTIRNNSLCFNCLRPGHLARSCTSTSHCKKCQQLHHTLLHIDEQSSQIMADDADETNEAENSHASAESNNHQSGPNCSSLLMTCQLCIHGPDGSHVQVRGLLDPGSSASFVSKRIAQSLGLQHSTRNIQISGVAGITHRSPVHSVARFEISPLTHLSERLSMEAIVVPKVTRDLPVQPIEFSLNWSHLSGLYLSDTDFGQPGKIDVLLGVNVYTEVMLQGRRSGPHGTPTAMETKLGWVLAGRTAPSQDTHFVESHHTSVCFCDDLLQKFWEIEAAPNDGSSLSPEEQSVMQHFKNNHSRSEEGRFIVSLPKNPHAKALGESRSQAVRRFLSLERSLQAKNQFTEFSAVMEEYIELGHAELVPVADLQKAAKDVFYLPMHAVRKEQSTTTKVRAVFDASAKTSTGISLNDTLLVGPTVHSSLLDVLIRFRLKRIALTADVSKMYRAVELVPGDRDLHRFVWRCDPTQPLQDYRMTRVTFGVSASPFAATMALKQNATDHALVYPLAAEAALSESYVDDVLSGADSVDEAIELQCQLQALFGRGGFFLRKWNSSDPRVLSHLPAEMKDSQPDQLLPASDQYTKTLGVAWNSTTDQFKLTVCEPPPFENVTKRMLVSDIAKTFDALGWFSPSTIKAKILFQRLWEQKVDWDEPVPAEVRDIWCQWRSELPLLSGVLIPRCYFSQHITSPSFELHGFSDASEAAYAAVVYLRVTDAADDSVQTSLVISKTKVAPLKKLTIPRLELCGAQLLAQLLHHVRRVLKIPLSQVHAWTDSTIVLHWLDGNPRRFKTYVGNRVSTILELIPSDKWKHVCSAENPADCASRGLFPSELIEHDLWWNGPPWLRDSPDSWPQQIPMPESTEHNEVVLSSIVVNNPPLIELDRFSSFTHLKRVTAWIIRFIDRCKHKSCVDSSLTAAELQRAETYWFRQLQETIFSEEIDAIESRGSLPKSSPLLPLCPLIDPSTKLLRVGGRQQLSQAPYSSKHPIVLPGKSSLTRSLIRDEHLRLLHAGPRLLASSLSRKYHIVGGMKVVRSVARQCLICRRYSVRPKSQLLGQLPLERVTPGPVFDTVGVDYAGPILTKYGYVRKPTVVKSYVCVFVSLTVKAVHLEVVSDLTSEAFIACFKRFIARRGLPSLMWSDNGTNFVGAANELKRLYQSLETQSTQDKITNYLSTQGITWRFTPQHSPHFGGIWEAVVKSTKTHLRKVLGDVKLTFEELSTLLAQIESCLNSRPLVSLNNDEDGIEPLTPGHFLIGRPLKALPDSDPERPMTLLRRWHLCKALLRHFWKRWSSEYITQLARFSKWHSPSRNLRIGDLVVLREDSPIVNQWPLARVVDVHPGKDGKVRVATIKTQCGTYTRPIVKLALLLPSDELSKPSSEDNAVLAGGMLGSQVQ